MYVTLPVRIALAGFLALRRRWWHLAAFAAAIVLSEVLIGSLKGIYDRARPPGSLVATSGASFPSGHAIAASVTVVAAVIALVPPGRRRAWWGAAAVAFSIVMGLSRAYLGAHWLSDATAGILLGTSCALVTALVADQFQRRQNRLQRPAGTQCLAAFPRPTALRTGDDRQESGRHRGLPLPDCSDVAYGPQRLNAIIGAYEAFLDPVCGTDDLSFHLVLELPAAETRSARRHPPAPNWMIWWFPLHGRSTTDPRRVGRKPSTG